MEERAARIETALQALRSQRALLGDAVVDTALASLQAELDQLRAATGPRLALATVLFADIVGSTALSRDLAPEAIHRVLDGALAAFTALIERHGGRVLQYAGDGLLAVFGADRARDDDAVQAVRAGLALLDEARAQATRAGLPGLGLRVGASSGQVLLGQGVDDAASIRGMPVNLAARMEQAAPPGALRVSHETWVLLRGRFEAEADEALVVKGCEAPVRTWLVRAERGPGLAGHGGRLRGREAEAAMLRAALDRAAGGQGPAGLLWLGEVGLGKSRLLAEAAALAARRGFAVWSATGQPPEAPYGLLRRLVGAEAAEGRPWLARLLGTEPAAEAGDVVRERGFAELLAHAAATAAGRPLLVVLDDLHGADEGSLDFLARLLAAPGPLPLLLVAAARPALDQHHPPPWPGPAAARLPLAPLALAAAQALAAALLRPCTLPGLAALLAERGEGAPMHMEALASLWRERGLLVPGPAGRLAAFEAEGPPPTLAATVQAGLDRLPAAERDALQAASVVGRVFWDAALPPAARALLPDLQARGLVQPQPAADLGAARAWRFRHQVLHERAYAGVLAEARRTGHRAAADWLAGQPGGAPLAAGAEHLERAGEPARAAEAWARAGADAAARWAFRDARQALERALALEPRAAPPLLWSRRRALQEALIRLDDAAAQRTNLAEMRSLAASVDPLAQGELALIEAEADNQAGRPRGALQALERLFATAPAGAHRLRGRAHGAEAVSWRQLGRIDTARECLARGLPLARRAGDRRNEAALLNSAGMLAMDQGDLEEAQQCLSQALALHRESGHQGNEAGTLCNLGYVDWALGETERAAATLSQAAELAAALGEVYNEGLTRVNLSLLHGQQGQPEEALLQAERALERLASSADPGALAAARRAAGLAMLALNQLAAAEAAFVAARDALDALGQERLALEPIAGLAMVALQRGDLVGARRAALLVLERAGPEWRVDGLDEPERVCLACADALQAIGDERAGAVRQAGRALLRARAERVGDPARRERLLSATALRRRLMEEPGSGLRTSC